MGNTISRPSDEVLTHNGIRVSFWFTGEADGRAAVSLPLFGGCDASQSELDAYNKASRVVKRRLEKLGFIVE